MGVVRMGGRKSTMSKQGGFFKGMCVRVQEVEHQKDARSNNVEEGGRFRNEGAQMRNASGREARYA